MRKIEQDDISRISEVVENILHYSDFEIIERMGGLTNHTYLVRVNHADNYVIRIPGEGTEKMISRKDEKVSTMLAYKLSIDAELIHFGGDGTKITRYIENAETLNMDRMKDMQIIQRIAETLKKLHSCSIDTGVLFDVFDMANTYEEVIKANSIAMYDDYDMVKSRVIKIKDEIDQHEIAKKVPCHNDPLCENWILSGERLYLIDWEYAGMNDGMWDLADVSIEADYDDKQDEALLRQYLGHVPTETERKRFMANKLYLDYLWTLWGKARIPFDDSDMETYAYERYSRLKRNLQFFATL